MYDFSLAMMPLRANPGNLINHIAILLGHQIIIEKNRNWLQSNTEKRHTCQDIDEKWE